MVTSGSSSKFSSSSLLFDKSYSGKENQLSLFLQLDQSFLQLAYFNEKAKTVVGFQKIDLVNVQSWESAEKTLSQIFTQHHWTNQVKNIKVCLIDKLYTLIPIALFDEEELETYLKFNHNISSSQELHYSFDKVEGCDAVIVYAIPKIIQNLLKKELPNHSISHFAYPLMESAILEKGKQKRLRLHIQQQRFDIMLFQNEALKFLNSFSYQTKEDFIYFLLYVMEQLKLDREEIEVELYGEFEENSALFEMLHKYIRNLKVIGRPKSLSYSAVLSEIPPQYYHNLFNQYLCE